MSPRIFVILVVIGNYFLSDSHLKGDVTITTIPFKIPSTPSDFYYGVIRNSNDSPCNVRVTTINRTPLGTLCELAGRFTITNTSGPGVLTISWDGWVSTSTSYSIENGIGYPGTTYDVDQVIQWGSSNGPMIDIATLGDNVIRTNDESSTIPVTEGIYIGGLPGRHFSVDCPIVNGSYNLDCVLMAYNTRGATAMENITLSFARTTSLKSVIIVPATPQSPAAISGTVSGGTPNGTAHLEASMDLGRTDPWQPISTITLDALGNGSFSGVQDTRPAATNARSDFFRVRAEP